MVYIPCLRTIAIFLKEGYMICLLEMERSDYGQG